jgi:hypothetical protein
MAMIAEANAKRSRAYGVGLKRLVSRFLLAVF